MNAVTAYCLLAIALTLLPVSVAFCGYMVAVGISMLSILGAMAALRLPGRYPAEYQCAFVRFPAWLLRACVLITIICSTGFVFLVALEAPSALLLYLGWTALITVWYIAVRRRLRLRGIDLAASARQQND